MELETGTRLWPTCRYCGAYLREISCECWSCHRELKDGDIIRQVETGELRLEERRLNKHAMEIELRSEMENWIQRDFPARPSEPLAVYDSQGSSQGWGSTLGSIYFVGAWVVGVIAFIVSWVYAVLHYGVFLGVGLCWAPALCIGIVAGFLWPLVPLALALWLIARM